MRRTIAACLLLSPLFAPQQLPDAKELLKQSNDTLKNHRSYQYETETTIDVVAEGSAPRHLSVIRSESVVNPDKRRIESNGQLGKITLVSNGKYTWVYVEAFSQYTKKAVSAGPRSLFDRLARVAVVNISQATGTPRTVREEPIEIDGSKYH